MQTLDDFIKGYPNTEVYLLAQHKSKDGRKFYLAKEPGHNVFYCMEREEVLDRKYISNDHLEKLSVAFLNDRKNNKILSEIKEQESYKYFYKFIKEQAGESYIFDL